MSVDTTMAVLYAQSGLSTNVANAAMVAPQAAVAMSRLLAMENARQENEKIVKTEKTEEKKVGKDGREGGSSFRSRLRMRRRMPETAEEEEPLRPKSPIIGNLLNVKV